MNSLLRAFMAVTGLIVLPVQAETELIGAPVKFHGTVVSRACDIALASKNLEVNFKRLTTLDLYRDGQSEAQPFSIHLVGCKPDVHKSVQVVFSGTPDSVLPGSLAMQSGPSGIAISLYDKAQQLLTLGQPTQSVALHEGNQTLNFSARVRAYPQAVSDRSLTGGDFRAVAVFTLKYL